MVLVSRLRSDIQLFYLRKSKRKIYKTPLETSLNLTNLIILTTRDIRVATNLAAADIL